MVWLIVDLDRSACLMSGWIDHPKAETAPRTGRMLRAVNQLFFFPAAKNFGDPTSVAFFGSSFPHTE